MGWGLGNVFPVFGVEGRLYRVWERRKRDLALGFLCEICVKGDPGVL